MSNMVGINQWPLKYSLTTAFVVARVAEKCDGTVAVVPVGTHSLHVTIERGSQGIGLIIDLVELFKLDSTSMIHSIQSRIDDSIRELLDQTSG